MDLTAAPGEQLRLGGIDGERPRKGGWIVRLRSTVLFVLAAMLGAAVVVLPAVAGGSETPPSIAAVNELGGKHKWSPATAAVGENGVVSFSNPGIVRPRHRMDQRPHPGPARMHLRDPRRHQPVGVGNEMERYLHVHETGYYTFYCTVHGPEMTGTVTVSANGTTT